MYSGAYQGLGDAVIQQGPTGSACVEGYWVRDPGAPGQQDRPETLLWPSPQGDVQFWPFGALYDETLDQLLAFVALRREFKSESYIDEATGIPVTRGGFFNDPAAHQFEHAVGVSGYVPVGGYYEVCGPIVEGPEGIPLLVVQDFQGVTPPSQRPPDPIEIQGELVRYVEPGTTRAWPMVEGFVVTSSQDLPTEESYLFNRNWNSGDIPVGSVLRILGYPFPDASPAPEIVPIDYTVLSRGDGEPDPSDVDFPEQPREPPPDLPEPPEYDPDPWDDIDRPEIDPDPWDDDDDQEDTDGANGEGPGDLNGDDLDDGNGAQPPDGNGAQPPDGNGAQPPSRRKFRDLALASFALFFLPSFLGEQETDDWSL